MALRDLLATEAIPSVLTGLLSQPVAGYRMLGGLLAGEDLNEAVRGGEGVSEAMTYAPRSLEGQAAMYGLGKGMEVLDTPARLASDAAYNLTGSPAVGAGVRTLFDVGVPTGAIKRFSGGAEGLPAGSVPAGPLGRQRGYIAGTNARKNADLNKLQEAINLSGQNTPDKDIINKTGWSLSMPGTSPRFEVPDDSARIKTESLQKVDESLTDAIEIRKLMDLNNLDLQGARNAFKKKFKRWPDMAGANTASVLDADALKELALQQIFPVNKKISEILEHPELFDDYGPEVDAYTLSFKTLHPNLRGSLNPVTKELELNTNLIKDLNDLDGVKSTLMHEIQHAIQDYEGFPQGGSSGAFESMGMSRKDALKAYFQLAGEIEARTVQERLKMTPEQKANETFAETFDRLKNKVGGYRLSYGDSKLRQAQ